MIMAMVKTMKKEKTQMIMVKMAMLTDGHAHDHVAIATADDIDDNC